MPLLEILLERPSFRAIMPLTAADAATSPSRAPGPAAVSDAAAPGPSERTAAVSADKGVLPAITSDNAALAWVSGLIALTPPPLSPTTKKRTIS